MRLVAGLGNPGPEYVGTRHNIGFAVVDRLAADAGIAVRKLDCQALTGRGRVDDVPVVLAKPVTFMNLSGESLAGLLKKLSLEPSEMLVVVDQIDLPLGVIRIKPGGSPGGHNGLKSVDACIGTDLYPRIRVGVRGERYTRENDLGDYVLDRFSASERTAVEETVARTADAVRSWLSEGIDSAMNRFNAIPE